jgi:chromosome segregation ATPase
MTREATLDQARKRLLDALDRLEAAVERRLDGENRHGALAQQVQAFSLDRSQLANELDGAQAHMRSLAAANREAAHRLDAALATIRAVIADHEGAGGDDAQPG